MFPIVVAFFSIIASLVWGDWKNWLKYLSTIQYFIIGDMLYNLFTWDYPLWRYPHPPNVFPNHLITNLFIMFTLYPSSMLIYLYRYPENNVIKQIIYILKWIALWLSFEFFMVYYGICVYTNGWNYSWSIIFASVMNLMLLLHYKRPKWAYILSLPIALFLLRWFDVLL
jgi:hypothetical protein